MEQAGQAKRTLHNIHQEFEGSPWLRRITLRYMARKIDPRELGEIDEKIGRCLPLVEDAHKGCSCEKRVLLNLRWVVDKAPEVQGEVLKCMARKIGVQRLRQLDRMIRLLRENPEKFRM